MEIRRSAEQDFDRIMEIYALARAFMAAHGNPNQWGPTNWPPEDFIRRDIAEAAHTGDLPVPFRRLGLHGFQDAGVVLDKQDPVHIRPSPKGAKPSGKAPAAATLMHDFIIGFCR